LGAQLPPIRWIHGGAERVKTMKWPILGSVYSRLRPQSLRTRLLIAATAVLTAFFLITGVALESAFGDSARQAQQDKLEGIVYSLLAALGPSASGDLTISTTMVPDARLKSAASSLQAALFNEDGVAVWRSVNFGDMPAPKMPGIDQWRFERIDDPDAFQMSYSFRWIDLADDPRRYNVVVMEDASSFRAQLRAYRRALWTWLAVCGVGLLGVQVLVLQWGLAPLRRLIFELRRIEMGEQQDIRSEYPDELKPLTQGLNAMIQNERNQQTRYRNALGDLAHSLKTPLAVVQGITEDADMPRNFRMTLGEQVQSMQQITGYQLRKAAAAGRRTLAEPVQIRPLCEKLVSALVKVYAEKNARFELQIDPRLRLRAESGDLFELIGNLLDNAAKYGNGQVRLSVHHEGRTAVIEVADNGPGFPEDAEAMLERGVRADMKKPGQGIGLAAVYDLVRAYEGQLLLGASDLGGALVTVRLPG
jgi:two-component system sensor histidine kinase PhoQ